MNVYMGSNEELAEALARQLTHFGEPILHRGLTLFMVNIITRDVFAVQNFVRGFTTAWELRDGQEDSIRRS